MSESKRFFTKINETLVIIDKKGNHKIKDMNKACEVLNKIAEINEKLYMCLRIDDELDREKMEALKDAETEIKLLNSYLVEKGLAEEYIQWKKNNGSR